MRELAALLAYVSSALPTRAQGEKRKAVRRLDESQACSFANVGDAGRCCWTDSSKFIKRSQHGFSYRTYECERMCARRHWCTHFSHSVLFGNCVICSGCDMPDAISDPTTKAYTSWKKQSCVSNATAVQDRAPAPTHLDDPVYKLIFRSLDIYAEAPIRPLEVKGWGTLRGVCKRCWC